MIGKTISHYQVTEKLGEGGMGVVYKADDTTLHRTVALKFLPEKASGSDQDKDRFLREARAAATLNHPNICTIYAIEQFEGRYFIAMEYVDGATLNEKIPFKMPNAAFDAAIQIGEALADAHAHGIVHRDIKSENIMITHKGQIKVMDFGLAKLKGSLKLTRTSSTVGTLGYMSPEQIQGGEVDHRSDIFSLGVLLFEMISGQLPFRGEHEAAMVYSIANEEPKNLFDLVPSAPAGLGDILAKALEKEPGERYQSAADFAVDLKRLKKQSSHSRSRSSMPATPGAAGSSATGSPSAGRFAGQTERAGDQPGGGLKLALIVTGILLASALGYIGYLKFWSGERPALPSMSVARLTEQAGMEILPDVSPDGNYIAYVKSTNGRSDIFVQRAGGGNPLNLTGTSDADNTMPVYSPKGDLIAFRSERDGGGIFVMGSTGESVHRITDFGYNPSWSPDGKSLVCATEALNQPFARMTLSKLWVVDVGSGKGSILYNGDGVQPRWSPDGQWIVFWGLPEGTGKRELWAIRATGGDPVRLTDDDAIDWNPVWSPDSREIYFLSDRGGTMNVWHAGFDPASGSLSGKPIAVSVPSENCTGLTMPLNGTKLVYVAGDIRANIFKIGFDPARLVTTGAAVPVTEGSRKLNYLSVSPDNRYLAFTLGGVQEDIGIIGVDGTGFRKLTNDRPKDRGPQWSPDGKKLAFYSERGGTYQIWMIGADGSGITRITDSSVISPAFWLGEKNTLYYQDDHAGKLVDMSRHTGEGGSNGVPLPKYAEGLTFVGESVSHDGKYLAGSVTHPDGQNRGLVLFSFSDSTYTRISDTGKKPMWLRDGRTIMFLENGRLKLIDVTTRKVTALSGVPDITAEGRWKISPDNRTLYFVRTESEGDIWEANFH